MPMKKNKPRLPSGLLSAVAVILLLYLPQNRRRSGLSFAASIISLDTSLMNR